jgi:hypothetical protein
MSGETDEKATKVSEILAPWLAGRFSIAREDGADDACSGHNRGPS